MRTLIIGGSGFLGSKLVESLNGDFQSTYHKNKTFVNQIQMDLGDNDSIKRCLDKTKPDVILHCGGLTGTDFCETNPELATRVNRLGTETLLNQFNGKLIYFSTDYVFDGQDAPYDERSEPNPINHYGKTKLAAEKKVLGRNGNLVIRVSGLYGANHINNRFLDGLRKSKIVRASQELISTPTYICDIARAIPDFMQMSGVLHFSGEQSFSRYGFAKIVVAGLGFDTEVIAQEDNMAVRRPKNSSLSSVYPLRKTSLDKALNEIRREI